jgi:hypothetical protein
VGGYGFENTTVFTEDRMAPSRGTLDAKKAPDHAGAF